MADRWVKRWKVPNSGGDGTWTVAIDKEGNYGCSCPAWKFQRLPFAERLPCHHIRIVMQNGGEQITNKQKPEYVLAQVLKPVYKKKENKLLVPLIEFGDPRLMEATICYYMLKYGYSWIEVKEIRGHIPHDWTKSAVIAHVERHGEASYPSDYYNKNCYIK